MDKEKIDAPLDQEDKAPMEPEKPDEPKVKSKYTPSNSSDTLAQTKNSTITEDDKNIGVANKKIVVHQVLGMFFFALAVVASVLVMGTTSLWCRRKYQRWVLERQLRRIQSLERQEERDRLHQI